MIKLLKTINKIAEGLMWLYLPIVLIYWTLSLIELDAIAPLKATVGIIVQPLILLMDEYFDFQFNFGGTDVDYTCVVLSVIVGGLAFLGMLNSRILEFVEEKLENTKTKLTKQKEIKVLSQKKEAQIQELNRYKALYVILKLVKIEKHDTYLVKKEDDSFSVGLMDSYESSIKNIAKSFEGREYKDFDAGPEITSFIFTDTEKFFIYLTYLTEKIKEINKGTQDDLNTVFSYTIACTCGYDAATARTDINLTHKMLNLVGSEEIFITNTLKQKLEILDTDISMKFQSKGFYMLEDKELDVYSLKIN